MRSGIPEKREKGEGKRCQGEKGVRNLFSDFVGLEKGS